MGNDVGKSVDADSHQKSAIENLQHIPLQATHEETKELRALNSTLRSFLGYTTSWKVVIGSISGFLALISTLVYGIWMVSSWSSSTSVKIDSIDKKIEAVDKRASDETITSKIASAVSSNTALQDKANTNKIDEIRKKAELHDVSIALRENMNSLNNAGRFSESIIIYRTTFEKSLSQFEMYQYVEDSIHRLLLFAAVGIGNFSCITEVEVSRISKCIERDSISSMTSNDDRLYLSMYHLAIGNLEKARKSLLGYYERKEAILKIAMNEGRGFQSRTSGCGTDDLNPKYVHSLAVLFAIADPANSTVALKRDNGWASLEDSFKRNESGLTKFVLTEIDSDRLISSLSSHIQTKNYQAVSDSIKAIKSDLKSFEIEFLFSQITYKMNGNDMVRRVVSGTRKIETPPPMGTVITKPMPEK